VTTGEIIHANIEAQAHRPVDIFGGFIIVKNYGNLPPIGVKSQWHTCDCFAVCSL